MLPVSTASTLSTRSATSADAPIPVVAIVPTVPTVPNDWASQIAERDEPCEDRLAQLAGAVGPLRRVLAALADRLIETKAHDRLCYARLGNYARERLGISGRKLQELRRVHRALAALPVLERALVSNELPWSKVRLVVRVASEEDEDAWIGRARALSTHRLAQEVKASRSNREDPNDPPPGTRIELRCSVAVYEKWLLAQEVAERVAGQRLTGGEALEAVVAEVSSELPIHPAFAELPEGPPARRGGDDRAGCERESCDRESCNWEPVSAARAASGKLPSPVASLAEGLADADAFELDRRLRAVIRLEQTLDAAIAPLLRRVTSPEYEWRGDYRPLASYARDELGMSASKARALLRLERAGDVCPELREAYRSGRLSWAKARCLLPLLRLDLDGEWRPIWVAWAERVSVRRLEQDVERALLLRAGHHFAWQRCKVHPEKAQDPIPDSERHMCAPDIEVDATCPLRWWVPVDVAGLFHAVHETLRLRMQAERGRPVLDGESFEGLLDLALLAWTRRDPRARRPDPVIERDGYLCAAPGCTSRRSLHDHHVHFRSGGGSDEPGNRLTLCAFHHQRCVHARLMRVRGRAPDGIVFEIGLRGDGPPLLRYRSGDIMLPQTGAGAPARPREAVRATGSRRSTA